ncbi:MAG: anti-sigma factor antagonist [Clostridia bacterium]|nr:anti-sigma factor antagonist [Clostridia bacterium]
MNKRIIYGENNILEKRKGHQSGMGVEILKKSTEVLAKIEGDIDHHTAAEIRKIIDENISLLKPKLLKLDFSGVQFMDSSGIGLIMGRFKLVKNIGGNLKVVNIPKLLERMIKMSGLTKLGIF